MELIGEDIILRPLKSSDSLSIAELCNNKKIWDNVRDLVPYPYTLKDAEDFIGKCLAEDRQLTFAIQYNDKLAGVIGLVPQSDIYRLSAEIGYWIGEPFWGLGITTSAVKLMVAYGFNQLELIRIFSGVFDYNRASQRVLEKAGFELEAVFKKGVYKNGRIYDEFRYAKIRDEI